eukprot:TRINITY_DN13094_c0_g2_i4.p1 TRINITY_DN13094_c0_g2~~TRINITY_DN13094_c0_g2_i4.p1  ORF type:complete len:519 (+),score=119.86 TRINITY_DN13094_c0_g2_i4:629-2185(+)
MELVDNSYNSFVPLITRKYHTNHPVPEDILNIQREYNENPEQYRKVLLKDAKKSPAFYTHPYAEELKEFVYTPEQLSLEIPDIKYKSLEDTPFQFIDKTEQLEELAKELNKATEFAVDLEHHAHRSFLGITCLMQISTRTNDYVVDVIALRKQMHVLQEPFANPGIVKVFHGADWDVKWLQRDFGIYVVNMFDTGQATRVLGCSSYSLAYLLKDICNVTANKQYQLADWRVRPLPEEMIHYAREDTHYLLYIYDTLRRRLISMAKMRSIKDLRVYLNMVLRKSKEISAAIYLKPETKDFYYYTIISHNAASLRKIQLRVLKLMLKWRDYIARIEDESINYICPKDVVVNVARAMPTKYSDLRECFKGKNMVPLLEKHVPEILAAISTKLQKHNEVVSLPIAEPMVIAEKIAPREPARGPVPEVKFCNEDNPGKLFHIAANQIKLNEPWSILKYYNQDEVKEEVNIETIEEKKVATISKKSKTLNKVQKATQKHSRKLEKLQRLARSSSGAGKKKAKKD